MKKMECVLCGGSVVQEKATQNFKCVECGANHDPDIYTIKKNKKKGDRIRFTKLKVFFSIIAALYLFYLALRVFIY